MPAFLSLATMPSAGSIAPCWKNWNGWNEAPELTAGALRAAIAETKV
jgi:hypothetical protein